MQSDAASDVDFLFDFHSWWGPWTEDNFLFTVEDLVDSPFLQALGDYEPGLGVTPSSGQPGMLRIWGMSSAGLNADFAYTPEFGFHPGTDDQRLFLYGENFVKALLDVIGAPMRCDLDGNDVCDVDDVDLLTAQGDLTSGFPAIDAKYDFDGDGDVDTFDLDEWLALAAAENGFPVPTFWAMPTSTDLPMASISSPGTITSSKVTEFGHMATTTATASLM